jgi:signal transduction histidine kinase
MNLKRRLGLALIALPVAITALFALLIWLVNARLESQTLDRILGRELGVLVESGAEPRQADGLGYYRPQRWPSSPPPPPLAQLEPGSYRDFSLPGGIYHVLVRQFGPGDRAYLTYDVRAFELRENYLGLALLAGVACCGLLAWLCSGWIALRALSPLDAVVARIRQIDVEGGPRHLELQAGDAELAPVVQVLNERLAQIEALLARERAFASAASHELRTPLAVIQGAAEVLGAQHGEGAALQRIGRAVREATQDLDALLALSRARELPPAEPLDLQRLLPQWAEPYAAGSHGTRLAWDLQPCVVNAPAGVLAIVFTNLLRNALRASAGGTVGVQLRPRGLALSDDGPGIAPADLKDLFEPGVRRSGGGSGMGLYIARTLAQRCGFTLQLHSGPGRGTCAELVFGTDRHQ